MKKHILIINTGGTISSIASKNGYSPKAGFVRKALEKMPEISHKDMPKYTLKAYSPLLDSSNISPLHWNKMANDISQNYKKYDGFIILHGTDTMAYTASALSFMLENLQKPVILTGSQIPLSELRNDAKSNIINALLLSASGKINEVVIYFNQNVIRGNRAKKVNASQFAAFDSPNFPHLARVGIQIQWQNDLLLKPPKNDFHLQTISSHYIANFRLFPGYSTEVLAHLLTQPLEGLILETYGAGNAQSSNKHFLQLLKEANKRGIIIVNCSQCHKAMVNMDTYETGQLLKKAGLISGFDMTLEAAHCKLLYLLSKYKSTNQIKKYMVKNLRGELNYPKCKN